MHPSHAARKRMSRTTHNYRVKFLIYLSAAFVPFLIIALINNVHFLNTHLSDTAEIVHGVSTQAASQLSSLYDITAGLAQNVRLHTILQDEVLPTYGRDNDYPTLSRNFLKLRSLTDSYLFFGDVFDMRFYLPSSIVVSNGSLLLDADTAQGEPWYAEYDDGRNIRRWYAADAIQGSDARDVLCLIYPIQDTMNFTHTIGYLRVDVSRNRIDEIIRSSFVIEGADCFLVNRDGSVILHDGVLSDDFLESYAVSSDSRYEYASLNGTNYLISVNPVSSSTMSIVYLVPRNNLTQNISANYFFQLALLAVEILLLAVVTGLFSYSLLSSKNNQLKLLNDQINPHFLYNTLDMINWQAINQNLPDIYRPIQALSRFYKITLNHGSDFIRVSDEMELLRLYLDLQNIRFKDSVAYQIEIDPEISDCAILHMVLQPIVENAVLHGIREKNGQSGSLHISARKDRGHLLFTIADDGVGMDSDTAGRLLRGDSSMGYGLSNIQQRIHLFYGAKYGLKITSAPNVGTTVQVSMPLHHWDDRDTLPF